MASGATKSLVVQEAITAIEDYLKNLVLNTTETEHIVVRISAIGAILSNLKNLVDYSDLLLNGDIHNIISGEDDVPVLKEVIVR